MPSKYRRKQNSRNHHRLFILSVEGEKCEINYFNALMQKSQGKNLRLVRDEGQYGSAPSGRFKALLKYCQENKPGFEDQCWLIVDVDRYQDQGNLQKTFRDCQEQGFHMAVTHPCFELWLLLHFADPRPDQLAGAHTPGRLCRYYKSQLSGLLKGRNKNDGSIFMPFLQEACRRAIELDRVGTNRENWPQSTGSHIYKLLNELLS